MGWDVIIYNLTIKDKDIDLSHASLPSFGLRNLVQAKLAIILPEFIWDDEQFAHLESLNYFGNIDLGPDEITPGYFWLGIYDGKHPLSIVKLICEEFNALAYDTVTSSFIDLANDRSPGWLHFKKFRDGLTDKLSEI
jgi:hypothetical protein